MNNRLPVAVTIVVALVLFMALALTLACLPGAGILASPSVAASSLRPGEDTRTHDLRGGAQLESLPFSGASGSLSAATPIERLMATQASPQSPTSFGTQPLLGAWDGDKVAAPRVIRDGDRYRMWYDGWESLGIGSGWGVGLAESVDGTAWIPHAGNPVLVAGGTGRWDEYARFQVSVLKDGLTYEMWYSGADNEDGPYQTGYATSTNGIVWNVYADQPVLKAGEAGSWDEVEANAPAVITDGGVYKMWYQGCDADYKACGIGYASSVSGTDWTKYGTNAVLAGTPGAWDEDYVMWPAVVKNGSTYMMWYSTLSQIGLATSPDGITWTKEASNPVIDQGWNGGPAVQPAVLLEDGTYKMWFRSGPPEDSSIGYAESSDGITWTLSPDNPVLTPGRMPYGFLPLAFKKHQRPEADIIFHHGVVLTMEANPAQAQAIAIRGSRILAVGSNSTILPLAGASTEVIDLGGRTLLPGFADGHTHVLRRRPEAWTLDETVDLLLGFGLTSVTEMSGSDDSVAELLTAESEGRLRLRVNVFPSYNLATLNSGGQTIYEGAWFEEHGPILDSNRRLRIPGIKIFADGAGVESRGCPAMTIPYSPTHPSYAYCFHEDGDLYLSQEDLNLAAAALQSRGFRVAFHAMGDRGIDTVLDAIEYALGGVSNSVYRHQIQHNSFLRPDQIDRYETLGILASVRGTWNTCDQEEYQDEWPDHYTQWVNRFALPGRGIHAYAEGDFSWSNPDPYDRTGIYTTVDPLLMLWGLVTRQQLDQYGSACQPEAWVAEHQISVQQALRMLTIEPAYAVSQETVLGSLKAGKFADVVILSGNPQAVDPDDLKDLVVLMTMVGGDTEYCKTGSETLCP